MDNKCVKKIELPISMVRDTDFESFAYRIDDDRVVEFSCSDTNCLAVNYANVRKEEYLVLPKKSINYFLSDLVENVESNFNLVCQDTDYITLTRKPDFDINLKPIWINLILPKDYNLYVKFANKENCDKFKNEKNPFQKSELVSFGSYIVLIANNDYFDKNDIYDHQKECFAQTSALKWDNISIGVDHNNYFTTFENKNFGEIRKKQPKMSEILEEKGFC